MQLQLYRFSSFCTQRHSSNAVDYPVYPEQSTVKLLLLELQSGEPYQEFYRCVKNIYCPFELNVFPS